MSTEDPIVRVLAEVLAEWFGEQKDYPDEPDDLATELAAALRRYFASEEVRERLPRQSVNKAGQDAANERLLAALHLTEEVDG